MAQEMARLNRSAQVTLLELQVRLPWAGLIESGPAAVALLGQLALVSGTTDFSLKIPPKDSFRHIKHPTSFAAVLDQMLIEAYNCFSRVYT